mgnify:CR=1 FL=1
MMAPTSKYKARQRMYDTSLVEDILVSDQVGRVVVYGMGILTRSQYLTPVAMAFVTFMAAGRCSPGAKSNEGLYDGVDLLDYIKRFVCAG